MDDTLTIAQIRAVQIGLRAVKTCGVCSRQLPVSAFYLYGVSICIACAEHAERAEGERAYADTNGSDECECGIAKPRTQPRCRWCQARQRLAAGA